MTVIAYDGRFVGADRMATVGSSTHTMLKLFRWRNKALSFDGDAGHGAMLAEWFRQGADPAKYPQPTPVSSGGVSWASLHVFQWGTPILTYEGSAYPLMVMDTIFGAGSGGGHAEGALAMGATVEKAIEIASTHASGCGFGMDVVDLKELSDEFDRADRGSPAAAESGTISSRPGAVQLRPAAREAAIAGGAARPVRLL